jgi:hypothetical protein
MSPNSRACISYNILIYIDKSRWAGKRPEQPDQLWEPIRKRAFCATGFEKRTREPEIQAFLCCLSVSFV